MKNDRVHLPSMSRAQSWTRPFVHPVSPRPYQRRFTTDQLKARQCHKTKPRDLAAHGPVYVVGGISAISGPSCERSAAVSRGRCKPRPGSKRRSALVAAAVQRQAGWRRDFFLLYRPKTPAATAVVAVVVVSSAIRTSGWTERLERPPHDGMRWRCDAMRLHGKAASSTRAAPPRPGWPDGRCVVVAFARRMQATQYLVPILSTPRTPGRIDPMRADSVRDPPIMWSAAPSHDSSSSCRNGSSGFVVVGVSSVCASASASASPARATSRVMVSVAGKSTWSGQVNVMNGLTTA